jgi:hypothetical protein
MSNTDSSKRRRFAIALSFPGERREYVEQVANALLPAFGGEKGRSRIFYDAWHESAIIGYASNRKLQSIYATESDLIVPFYCQDYLDKKWCGVELRAIEQLLIDQEYERVLPFRFDRVEIPGSFRTDIFPIVSDRPAEDVARLILDRYRELYPLEEAPSHHDGRSAGVQADISRIMKYAPSNLIGRETETKVLNDAWDQVVRGETKRPHILTFVALGGEGKTSVVAKWAVDLAFQDWPGCDAALAWSFYSRARGSSWRLRPTCFSTRLSPSSATRPWRPARRAPSTRGGGWPNWLANGERCSSLMAWSRCNTRLPRPRRAS